MIQIPPSIKIAAMATIEMQTPEGAREFKSRIEDIVDGALHLALPTERGEPVAIPTGQYVTIAVTTASSANMFVEAEVMGRRINPFPMLICRPMSIETNQQRTFHRVQVRIEPTAVWWWTGEGDPPPASRPAAAANGSGGAWQRITGTIVDLSGGGIGLLSDDEVPRNSVVQARFPLPVTKEPFEGRGRVMLARSRPQGDVTKYQLGIQFEGLSKADQERLVKANHQYQIEERRRARGL